jgi:hypothetical protein
MTGHRRELLKQNLDVKDLAEVEEQVLQNVFTMEKKS